MRTTKRLQARRTLSAMAAATVLMTAGAAGAGAAATRVDPADDVGAADTDRHRSPPSRGQVSGSVQVDYPWAPADDVRFSVTAHATFDPESPAPTSTRARGRARIQHRVAEADVVAWAVGRVECLSMGGRAVTGSMIVTHTAPVLEAWRDKRIGFSILADGPEESARAGWTEPMERDALPECAAPAPHLAVDRGRFTVSMR